jgi:glycosyltransferase involved in cell wall biosynthesis
MNPARPFFSVVVPAYNRAAVITRAINSALDQSFSDLEVVAVDDGSGDDTAARAEAIQDPRLRVIRHERNAGGGAARNTGIDAATGRYVAFLDSDDYFLPGKLAAVHRALEAAPDAWVYHRCRVDRGDAEAVRPYRPLAPGESVGDLFFIDREFLQTSTLTVPSELCRRVRFDPLLRIGQDTDFLLRVQQAEVRSVYLPEVLSVWVDRDLAGRVGNAHNPDSLRYWLAKNENLLTERAVYGFRATMLAPAIARDEPFTALGYIMTGATRARLAPRSVVQALLRSYVSPGAYRRIVNAYLRVVRRGLGGRPVT